MTRSDNPMGGRAARRTAKVHLLPLYLLVTFVLACSLPGRGEPTATVSTDLPAVTNSPTPPPPPTSTPQPLPPAIVESDPPPGPGFPLQGPLTLYFNQPMERSSVESALSGQPSLAGSFEWLDDTTVIFEPDAALLPDTELSVSVGSSARAANGLALAEPLRLEFRTVAPLQIVQTLPEPEQTEVNPSSALVVTFNQPVVPLGETDIQDPEAFYLEPPAEGKGEWVNTSTYIFYPEPPLAGGINYSAHVNPDLRSSAGAPLVFDADKGALIEPHWAFTTAQPRLETVNVDQIQSDVPLDIPVEMNFNQPMDAQSMEENFNLLGPGAQRLPGQFGWNTDFTTLTFTPTQLLERGVDYTLILLGSAQAQGGTALGQDFSTQFRTVPDLSVVRTEPEQEQGTPIYGGVVVYFSGPIESDEVLNYIMLNPFVTNLRAWWDGDRRALYINGDFTPVTNYSLRLSSQLSDPWGGTLGSEFKLDFHTNPLDPELILTHGGNDLFLTPQETSLTLQATNLSSANISVGSVPFADYVRFLTPGGFDILRGYQPADERTWTHPLNLPGDRVYPVDFPLIPEGGALSPGLYRLAVDAPGLRYTPGPILLVVSNVHLTFKLSPTEALVWAVDLRDNQAVAEAPISIYDSNGNLLASGRTDGQGVFEGDLSTISELEGEPVGLYENTYALLGQPGEQRFALSLSTWNQGIAGWDFSIPTDYSPPGLKTYLYTDRPIYRPGHTVYFRAVLRYAQNGRYSLPEMDMLPVSISGPGFEQAETFQLPLSEFGTAHGEYTLPENAQPGYYTLGTKYSLISFQVAEYRKPEINLRVDLSPDQVLAGSTLTAEVEARYFFDAPAGDVPLQWSLYARGEAFNLPGYRVGVVDENWLLPPWMILPTPFGELIASGEGRTRSDGVLAIELPPAREEQSLKHYTLEVTLKDESGAPVSGRDEIDVHPSAFYIGMQPDTWIGQVGKELGYEVKVVGWEKKPAGIRELRAEFSKVIWVRSDTPDPFGFPQYEPQYTPVSSADFSTASDGEARLAFTPFDPGTYQLEVSGGGARSQTLLWVAGAGQAAWPKLPNQRLELTADQDHYLPGDSAQVFIPNPLGESTQALVTIERGGVLRHQVLKLDSAGITQAIPLSAEEAPNVYVSVTLLGQTEEGYPDFRVGYLNLPVEPVELTLQVELTSQPERAGPRDEVTFGVRVTDAGGRPVQGEFSLAVVDLAALALAEPNAPDIVSAFYGEQPLSVRTGLGLAVYSRRLLYLPGGMGGGGGEAQALIVREEFPDTAFWEAEIVTDENGEAQVSLALPDSLTTWQVEARGLTADTRVGQAESKVVTSKDLLVRPVTPRFLTLGDHVRLAAVVHNNSEADLDVEASLQPRGFTLDEGVEFTQRLSIPAGGRVEVAWWGTVQDAETVDLIFSVHGGGFQDATRPVWGGLPVLRYISPHTFSTAGTLAEEAQILELVSLPRSFDTRSGSLQVELAPSLAAAMIPALESLEHNTYECTEQTLSRFLPNLMAYDALQNLGLDSPDLNALLERTLNEGLERLIDLQNEDGGWGWWSCSSGGRMQSDAYITAYVLFGLIQAQEEGVFVDEVVIEKTINYLIAALPANEMLTQTWQYDRLAFEHYVLTTAGRGDLAGVERLYDLRERLNPWAQAFLALSLENLSPDDERVETLFSDLERSAIRTSTSAHWEEHESSWQNMSTPVFTSAVVVYALGQRDPASTVLPGAVRYLMAHRGAQGAWASTYETAWTLLALIEFMKGTGELSGDFAFSAELNGAPLIGGQTNGETRLSPASASVPVSELFPADPNALTIERESGVGRLYYSARLNVARPVEQVTPLEAGISVARSYLDREGQVIEAGAPSGELVTVKITLALENDAYFLVLEDHIPAGSEILDPSLVTSQQGVQDCDPATGGCYDPRQPFIQGWGWWLLSEPHIYDDHISWSAEYLPAGTYELTYTLSLNQEGEYRVIPARAWQYYFPEVQGRGAGHIFKIED